MKKFALIFSVVMCFALIGEARQRNVRDFFCAENGTVFTLLPKNTRLDMLDYYDNGQKKLMPNVMTSDITDGTGSRLVEVTQDKIIVEMSSKSEITIELLYVSKRDTIICVVNTVKLPSLDSRIDFYDTSWNKLNADKIFQVPVADDFFVAGCGEDEKTDALRALPFFVSSYSIEKNEAGKTRLVVTPQVEKIYSKEEWKRFGALYKQRITYVLSGKKFKKEK